jgi:hypothetical protein
VNGPRKVLQVLVAVFAFTSFGFCSASAFYITRDGAGSKNGSSLANAAACDTAPGVARSSCAAFSSSANWGSGSSQIGPGTVVYVGGDSVTITASSPTSSSGYFEFQGSGSSGSVIELQIQTIVTAPVWCCSLSGGAININSQSYVLVDGGAQACGWNTATNTSEGTCGGSIQASANGDGLANSSDTTGIYDSSCDNVEVRNLGLYNLYVKSNVNEAPTSNAISIFLADVGAGTNCLVHDNMIHDDDQLIVFSPTTSSGPFNVYRNELYNMNQGIIDYSAGTSVGTWNIYGNHIHDMGLWDVNGLGYPYHHDGIYLTNPNAPQTITTLNVYNNIFDGQAQGVNGGPTGQNCATSWFFLDGNDTVTTAYFYNNVVMSTTACTTTGGGNPLIGWEMARGTSYIYNNTFVCAAQNAPPGGIMIGASGQTAPVANAFNNLFVNCGTFVYLFGSPGASSPPTTGWDYNVYADNTGGNQFGYQGCCQSSFADWQAAMGQDSHGKFTSGSPGLGGSYENGSGSPMAGIVPQSSSAAKSAGLNLTVLGIAALNSDITGAARPTGSTAWDAGALQSSSGSVSPNPPTGLAAVVE